MDEVSGGQTLIGGTDASDDLVLNSTSNATKGKIFFGANSVYDEVNDRWGIGETAPAYELDIAGTVHADTYLISSGANSVGLDGYYTRVHGTGGVKLTTSVGGYYSGVTVAPATGNVGIGNKLLPTASLHTKGATSDDSAYALKVDDSSDSSLLSVRNDGVLTTTGARIKSYTIKSSIDTITNSDTEKIYGDTDGGAFTLTLPATPTDGILFSIKNTGTAGNDLTIDSNGNTIDGSSSDLILIDNESVYLQYTSDGWKII